MLRTAIPNAGRCPRLRLTQYRQRTEHDNQQCPADRRASPSAQGLTQQPFNKCRGQGVKTAVSLRYIRASPRYPDTQQPTAAERFCSETTRNPYPASAKIYRKKIKKRLTFHLSSIFLLFFKIYFCQWVKTLISFIFICSSKFAFCWRVSERHR